MLFIWYGHFQTTLVVEAEVFSHMNVQKVYLLQQSQNLGESHPVPVQALPTYENYKRQSHGGA